MTSKLLAAHPNRTALLSAGLTLPAVALVVQGFAFSLGGWTIGEAFLASVFAHPAIIVGGLVAALTLNALATLRLHVRVQPEEMTVELTIRRCWANLIELGVGAALGLTIFAYVLVENV